MKHVNCSSLYYFNIVFAWQPFSATGQKYFSQSLMNSLAVHNLRSNIDVWQAKYVSLLERPSVKCKTFKYFVRFLPERDYVTFGSLLSQFRLSVCLSVVCNVGAPYSGGWTFWQNFFTAVYAGHPLTSVQNFTDVVPGKPLRRER